MHKVHYCSINTFTFSDLFANHFHPALEFTNGGKAGLHILDGVKRQTEEKN